MNTIKIRIILRACSIMRKLKESKLQIREIADLRLANEPSFNKIVQLLKEATQEIDYKALFLGRKIKNMVSELEGFDPSIHKKIDYISTCDIKDGLVDISLADDEFYFIDLKTGEIISAAETPEEKRNR